MSELLNELRDIVGPSHVLDTNQVSTRPTHVWDARPMQAKALVRPANTTEVSAVLQACYQKAATVVTHGGTTGLADGEKSTLEDIVLSLERMNKVEGVDSTGATLTAQAGCVLEQIQITADEHNLMYGVDLGARGSCTIGGNIATNAGGLSVLRYGMTREQVLGLEVVLADGTVLSSMNAMLKNNAGFDLKQLFIGSEGTLGVVTRAVLRLRSKTTSVNTCMLAFDHFEQVTDTLALLSADLSTSLSAFEVIWNPYYQLTTDQSISGTSRPPLDRDHPLYVIAESRGSDQGSDDKLFQSVLEKAFEQELIVDAVVAQSEQERKDIWYIRENVDMVLRHAPNFIYDISLPIVAMQQYLDNIELALKAQWPQVKYYAYGHMADGNLHITVAPFPEHYSEKITISNDETPVDQDSVINAYELCNRIIFEPLQKLGGSISAEHGIGTLKKKYLHYSRTPEEIALMQALKNTLDTKGILNPGKIVD